MPQLVNSTWCLEASRRAAPHAGVALLNPAWNLELEAVAGKALLSGLLPPSVWPVNPFRLNERLTIQKGAFLAPGDVTKSFVENLIVLPGHEERSNITKFVLPSNDVAAMLRELYMANVTEATLFPGLDGFARSLRTSARFLELQVDPRIAPLPSNGSG